MKTLGEILRSNYLLRNLGIARCRKKWRYNNQHNFTTMSNAFDASKVIVGKGTYGPLSVLSFDGGNEKLLIGNYCSIAPEVVFLLDGEHHYDRVSTYPFRSKFLMERAGLSKGNINVGDDVWIGFRSLILSGVTIGRGAIIAAGAVVVSDIPPYAIAGGCPAKVIKYRFQKKVIDQLSELDYSSFDKDYIVEHIDDLEATATADVVATLEKGLKK